MKPLFQFHPSSDGIPMLEREYHPRQPGIIREGESRLIHHPYFGAYRDTDLTLVLPRNMNNGTTPVRTVT